MHIDCYWDGYKLHKIIRLTKLKKIMLLKMVWKNRIVQNYSINRTIILFDALKVDRIIKETVISDTVSVSSA